MTQPYDYSIVSNNNTPTEGNMEAGQVSDNFRDLKTALAKYILLNGKVHNAVKSANANRSEYTVTDVNLNIPAYGPGTALRVIVKPNAPANNALGVIYFQINNSGYKPVVNSMGVDTNQITFDEDSYYEMVYDHAEDKWVRMTFDNVPPDSVGSNSIVDRAVRNEHIRDDAVTADKIADDAVTGDKIADDAVTADKIADDAVTADKIADGAVTEDKIADGVSFHPKAIRILHAGNYVIPAGAKAILIEASGGGGGADERADLAGNGGDTLVLNNAIGIDILAPGGFRGDAAGAVSDARATGARGGDFVVKSGAAGGATGEDQGHEGQRGGVITKFLIHANLSNQVLNITYGAGGARSAGYTTDGQPGWVKITVW